MQMIIYLVFQHCQPHSYGTNNGYICQPHPIYLAPGLDGSLGTLTFSNVCGNVWSLKVWHLEHSFMIALPWTLGKFLWEFVRVQHLGEKQPVFFLQDLNLQNHPGSIVTRLFWPLDGAHGRMAKIWRKHQFRSRLRRKPSIERLVMKELCSRQPTLWAGECKPWR